jgi:hypothetical protein
MRMYINIWCKNKCTVFLVLTRCVIMCNHASILASPVAPQITASSALTPRTVGGIRIVAQGIRSLQWWWKTSPPIPNGPRMSPGLPHTRNNSTRRPIYIYRNMNTCRCVRLKQPARFSGCLPRQLQWGNLLYKCLVLVFLGLRCCKLEPCWRF